MNYADPYQLPNTILTPASTHRRTPFPADLTFPDFSVPTSTSSSTSMNTLPKAPIPLPPSSLRRTASLGGKVKAERESGNHNNNNNNKKKRSGPRGRMMKVKILYSLATAPTSDLSSSLSLSNAPTPFGDRDNLATAAPSHSYTCLARLSAPVWVQLLGPIPASTTTLGGEAKAEYGKLTLKTCLSAICISRPELVTDSTKDYAVAAVDPYESSLQPTSPHPSSNLPAGGQGLMEGKGMLSWNLAEKREGTTWVCGRVVRDAAEDQRRVRRKLNRPSATTTRRDHDSEQDTEDDDNVDDEDEEKDTLEVWLQLVERPSFTQTQFLTSLRSFANPAQPMPAQSSDRPSPPMSSRPLPPSRLPSSSTTGRRVSLGDPVKKKRPRTSDPTNLRGIDNSTTEFKPTASSSSLSALPLPLDASSSLAGLPAPQVLALLSQLIPSLATNGTASASTEPALDLHSAQGRALLPAIRTLAQFYGVAIPESSLNQSNAVASTSTSTGPSRAFDIQIHDSPEPIPVAKTTTSGVKKIVKGKGKGKAVAVVEAAEEFLPLPSHGDVTKGKGGTSFMGGCANCKRKKSAIWRESTRDGMTTVCNACGVFFNKNGHHRATTNDRNTSPAPASTSAAPPLSSRPLKGRLTATCESELLSRQAKHGTKKRKVVTGGAGGAGGIKSIVGASKSSAGPSSRSPGINHFSSIFKEGSTHASGFIMTSPGRSPRRSPRSHGFGLGVAATSPVRARAFNFGGAFDSSGGAGGDAEMTMGGSTKRHGRESPSKDYDFSAMYSGHQSPSPARRTRSNHLPSYLMTASPGTALKRILSDTNVDLDGFEDGTFDQGMSMQDHHQLHGESMMDDVGDGTDDLSFFLRSSPEVQEKEVDRPSSVSPPTTHVANQSINLLTTATDGPSTDFDSILSSLRRDFSTRLSSNALTAPSSPPVSSPCVQPRTSSATPGAKGKAPASSGRAAPSIFDSFIDGLVPALVLNPDGSGVRGEDGMDDSDNWPTPATEDHDLTLMLGDDFLSLPADFPAAQSYSPSQSQSAYAAHVTATTTTTTRLAVPHHHLSTLNSESSFDFGSLPPSSPPALPTPSDFEGITPESHMELNEDEKRVRYRGPSDAITTTQGTVAALLQSLGLPAIDASAWTAEGGLKTEGGAGGEAAVTQLLQLISAKALVNSNETAAKIFRQE